MTARVSIAARVAGVVGATGYLFGVVEGPLLGLIGSLALVAFGRALVSAPPSLLLSPASFAVVAGAAGVAALRWGTLDLTAIGGIHAVLGPLVLVEPASVATLGATALGAAVIAGGIGAVEPGPGIGAPSWWWWAEVATSGGVLALLFVGSPVGGSLPAWLGAAGIATAAMGAIARLLADRSIAVRSYVLVSCGALVATAAVVAGLGS